MRERQEVSILDTWYLSLEEQFERSGDAEVCPGGMSGLEIKCPRLEVRPGVGELARRVYCER